MDRLTTETETLESELSIMRGVATNMYGRSNPLELLLGRAIDRLIYLDLALQKEQQQ